MLSGLLTAFPFAALFLSGELFARQTAGAAFSSAADALPSAAEAVWAAFVLRRRRASPDSLLKTPCHCERMRLALAGGCPVASIHEPPRRGLLGNWASGVRNSRKRNLCHYSLSKTLYVGVILCAADEGYARKHEQLSDVIGSRKPI